MKLYKDSQNNIFAYELDGSQDDLIGDKTQITKEQADEINKVKAQQNFAALSYDKKREAEYPSYADQFDLLYHGGYDAWKAAIDAVKTKYPKGA
jgi:hypothetical protein